MAGTSGRSQGIRFGAVQHNPDRLLHPMQRTADGWRPISWDDAIGEIGSKLAQLVERHGDQTVAYFMGSPAGLSVVNPLFRQAFFDAIGTRQRYGVGSVDCNNKFRVADDMYGFRFFVSFPDIDNTRFVLLVGSNPEVSHSSLFQFPRPVHRLRAVVARGGRWCTGHMEPLSGISHLSGIPVTVRPAPPLGSPGG